MSFRRLAVLSPVFVGLLLFPIAPAAAGCQARIGTSAVQIPTDFAIQGLAGGVNPWEENHSLHISEDGEGLYARFVPGDVGAPQLERTDFTLSREELGAIWEAVVQNDFFSLAEDHRNDDARGGSFASLTVTAHGSTHRVRVQNVSLPRFEAVLAAVNEVSPPGSDLIYRGPDDVP